MNGFTTEIRILTIEVTEHSGTIRLRILELQVWAMITQTDGGISISKI